MPSADTQKPFAPERAPIQNLITRSFLIAEKQIIRATGKTGGY